MRSDPNFSKHLLPIFGTLAVQLSEVGLVARFLKTLVYAKRTRSQSLQ